MDYLEEHESMAVSDICSLFQVSRDTARRDIVKLAEQGTVVRTHGGIALAKFIQKTQEYALRLKNEPEGKLHIGKRAASYIRENEMIFLDVSTTVRCMIPNLNVQSLTVVTHSLDNAWALLDKEGIQTHLLGGMINRKLRHLTGCGTLKKLEDYRFSKVFLGAAGITNEGIYYYDEDDMYFKRELVKRSGEAIILADHTKFGRYSAFKGLDFSVIGMIITNQPVGGELQEIIEGQGIKLIVAQEN
ncbi:lacr bacterial regulatory protein hth signature [Lucifera butyrica]|uniref:Lacr bacterial regulatory protein hth signature n=1 Tax=Lucifera butyrica TaxID=1351585 RepID=A0A498RDI5_9FIRM|nr:lacr bacterial regulatory protein hth signature [Lucifera butyrica]